MRIRVARRMYGQFVAAGKGACCGELINPVSEVRGEPPYRTVFTVNPMENFEISEVLVSEEDMEKIQQLQEVLMDSRICLYTETRQKWRVSSILQRSWYL